MALNETMALSETISDGLAIDDATVLVSSRLEFPLELLETETDGDLTTR